MISRFHDLTHLVTNGDVRTGERVLLFESSRGERFHLARRGGGDN